MGANNRCENAYQRNAASVRRCLSFIIPLFFSVRAWNREFLYKFLGSFPPDRLQQRDDAAGDQNSRQRAGRIDEHIPQAANPALGKALVQFIQAGHGGASAQGKTSGKKRTAPCCAKRQRQQKPFYGENAKMRQLAQKRMNSVGGNMPVQQAADQSRNAITQV